MKVKIQKTVDIKSVEDWFFAAPPKGKGNQWKDNFSAKELAKFATSSEFPKFLSDLLKQMGLKGTDVTCIPEYDTSLPCSTSGPRNHDLLVIGKKLVIGIEAKVNEPYSETVKKEYDKGSKDKKSRIDWMKHILFDDENINVDDIRYQLLTGTCGTLLEALRRNMTECMFLSLTFDVNGNGGNKNNTQEFEKFCAALQIPVNGHKKFMVNDPKTHDQVEKAINCHIVKRTIKVARLYSVL